MWSPSTLYPLAAPGMHAFLTQVLTGRSWSTQISVTDIGRARDRSRPGAWEAYLWSVCLRFSVSETSFLKFPRKGAQDSVVRLR